MPLTLSSINRSRAWRTRITFACLALGGVIFGNVLPPASLLGMHEIFPRFSTTISSYIGGYGISSVGLGVGLLGGAVLRFAACKHKLQTLSLELKQEMRQDSRLGFVSCLLGGGALAWYLYSYLYTP